MSLIESEGFFNCGVNMVFDMIKLDSEGVAEDKTEN